VTAVIGVVIATNSVTFSVPSLNIPSTRPQLTVLSPTRDPKTKNEKTEINLTLSNHNSNKSSPVHVQCSQQRNVDNKDDATGCNCSHADFLLSPLLCVTFTNALKFSRSSVPPTVCLRFLGFSDFRAISDTRSKNKK
jgi:hypothetical protein